mgnify:FL=1|jgi:hypothetical protein
MKKNTRKKILAIALILMIVTILPNIVKAENTTSTTTKTTNNSSTATKSNIATLSDFGIKPHDFSGFKPNTLKYSVDVPSDTETVEIYAVKGQSGQLVAGTGIKKLKDGANTFEVVVTAEDGKTKNTYTLTINRKSNESSENTQKSDTNNSIQENITESQENQTSNELIEENEQTTNTQKQNEVEETKTTQNNSQIKEPVQNNKTEKNSNKKSILILGAVIIIAVVAIVVVIIKRDKEPEERIPLIEEFNKEKVGPLENEEEYKPKRKRHAKGKRFK